MVHRESARGGGQQGIMRGRDAALAWSELSRLWMEMTGRGTRMEPEVKGKAAIIYFKMVLICS